MIFSLKWAGYCNVRFSSRNNGHVIPLKLSFMDCSHTGKVESHINEQSVSLELLLEVVGAV